jgi:NAD(P) transhydrogenase
VVCNIKSDITVRELMYRTDQVIQKELDVIQSKLFRNGITIFPGYGSLKDRHTIGISEDGGPEKHIEADTIIIATGSRPYRDPDIDYNNEFIFDGESILKLDRIPRSLTILGGGVIGCEYASIFAHLGVRVSVVEAREQLMPFLDKEISDALTFLMRKAEIKVALGEKMNGIDIGEDKVCLTTESGRKIYSEKMLVTLGRVGNTENMGLEKLGIKTDDRGLMKVDDNFYTGVEKIYGVGDVIGFPSLASVSQDQGRMAVRHAFNIERKHLNTLLPFGIYTIPEISIVGETEQSLTEKGIAYETGTAHFFELARGQIANDHDGILKLIFCPSTRKLYGVHIIGERATEMIHIGQAVISYGGTIDYFIETVFNFPTMSEAYKLAALNGLNTLE